MATRDGPRSAPLAAIERAARYRRRQVTDPRVTYVRLQNDITTHPVRGPLHLDRHGWARIGDVVDGFACNAILAVWWHPETNQVSVERPPVYEPPIPSTVEAMRCVTSKGGVDSNPIVTQPGYIYTYLGVDYDDDAAARLAISQHSIDGWTWRKR
jgi:hypothetical protein